MSSPETSIRQEEHFAATLAWFRWKRRRTQKTLILASMVSSSVIRHTVPKWMRKRGLVAEKHYLVLLADSDAHSLSDIGRFHNEIEIDKIYAQARAGEGDYTSRC